MGKPHGKEIMKVNIITDSACDMSLKECEALNVIMLPLAVSFGETTYLDGVDLDHDAFFNKLIETDTFPKTSQITPYEYGGIFNEISEKGEEVVCITVSGKLSGCYQSACVAAADYPNVHVTDSLNACIGERILVEHAVALRDMGLGAKEICAKLDEIKSKIRVIALLDTLEYLKKGGRISSTVAFAGTLLSIKPVVAISNGEVALLGKARGSKNGNNKLIEMILADGEIDFDMPYCLAYSGLSRQMLDKYIEDSKALYEGKVDYLPTSSIGCAIGAHIGPGAIAVAYFVK